MSKASKGFALLAVLILLEAIPVVVGVVLMVHGTDEPSWVYRSALYFAGYFLITRGARGVIGAFRG